MGNSVKLLELYRSKEKDEEGVKALDYAIDCIKAWDELASLLPSLAGYESSDGQDLVQASDIMEFMHDKGILDEG